MEKKPAYKELEQMVKELEKEAAKRKQAEEALRRSEQEIRVIADNLPTLFSYVDKDGRYRFVNKRYEEWFGLPQTEIVGEHYRQILGEATYELIKDRVEAVLSGHRVCYEDALPYIHGGMRWVTADYVPDIDDRGKVNGFFALVTDITERKRAEEELMSSREKFRNLADHLQSVREEERTSIAREIHDELAQTLTALKMDISWLGKKLPKDRKPLLEKTKAMTKLTDMAIKTVKKISTELRPGFLDDLGLVAAIEWQAEEFQHRTGIRCEITVDPKEIILDRDRSTTIFRIFQETLTNVARHAHATRVAVSLKEKDGTLELTVIDNGKGITKKQISGPQSFGLMGIRERVHPWGGEVNIKGSPGEGTTVIVNIALNEKGL